MGNCGEFKASLVYVVSLRTVWTTIAGVCLKKVEGGKEWKRWGGEGRRRMENKGKSMILGYAGVW